MYGNINEIRTNLNQIIQSKFGGDLELQEYLLSHFTILTDALVQEKKTASQKKTLVYSLGMVDLDKVSDTEDRENVAELYSIISKSFTLDIAKELNVWMYGRILGGIAHIKAKVVNTQKPLQNLEQACIKCSSLLGVNVISRSNTVPDRWYIVSCNSCSQKNVFNIENGSRELSFVNCTPIQSYLYSEYSEQQIGEMVK